MVKIRCQCNDCDCLEEFEQIDKELLLNLITHGRVEEKRAQYLKSRVGSTLCKNCFVKIHQSDKKWKQKQDETHDLKIICLEKGGHIT